MPCPCVALFRSITQARPLTKTSWQKFAGWLTARYLVSVQGSSYAVCSLAAQPGAAGRRVFEETSDALTATNSERKRSCKLQRQRNLARPMDSSIELTKEVVVPSCGMLADVMTQVHRECVSFLVLRHGHLGFG